MSDFPDQELPRPFPPRAPQTGRWARLEPLVTARHGADLSQCLREDDEVWTHLPYGPFQDGTQIREWLSARESWIDPLTFAILEAASGRALGLLSLQAIRPEYGVVEIAHVLMSRELQRSRVASDAIHLAMRLAFDGLGYRRVEWKCDARNARSRRAALRFGFRFEGIFRQHMVVKGRSRDTVWYAMIDRDWPRARAAFDAWLAPENFDEEGVQRARLADLRRQTPQRPDLTPPSVSP
jgi:RimJ/RimL family protein N-acetyltransferase